MKVINQKEQFREAYKKALGCNWNGGAASIKNHLRRRIKRGHLSDTATETELVQMGKKVLNSPDAKVYEYIPSEKIYFVIYKQWALFFDENGLWDTVFPPDVPDRYFASVKGYKLLGKLSELIK